MEEHLDALELAMAAGAASRPGGFAHLLSCDHAALVTQRLQEYASGDVFAATGGRDVDLAEATRVLELGVRLARLGVRDVARSSAAATAAAAAAKRKKGARAGNKQAAAAEAAEDAAASNAASAVRLTERARLAAAAADGLRAARCDGHVGGRLLAATPPGPRLREAERERAALRWQALAHLPAAYFEATLPCLRPPTSSGGGREAADGPGTQQLPHAAWREVERFEDDAVTVFAAPLPAAEDPAPEPAPAEAAAAAPGSGTLVEEAGEGTADPPEPEPEPASVAGHSLYAQAGAFFTRHAHVAGEVAAAAAAAAPAKLSADTLLRRQLEERVRHQRLAREASRAEKKRNAPGAAAATATAAATYRISVVSPVLVAPKKVAARRTRVKLRASPDDNCNALPRSGGGGSGGGVPQPAELQLLPEAPAAALRTSDAAPAFDTLLCYGGASGGVLDDVATLRAALARNDVDSLVGGFADERLREEVVEVPMAAMEEADVVCRLPKPPQLEGGTPPGEAAVCVSAGDGDVEGGGGGGGGTKRKWLETLQEQMASSICKIVTGHRRFKVSKVGAILAEILGKQTAPAAAAPGGRQQEARMAEVYRRAKEDGSVPVTPQVVFAALVQHAHHSNLKADAGAHLRLRSEKNEIVITREGA